MRKKKALLAPCVRQSEVIACEWFVRDADHERLGVVDRAEPRIGHIARDVHRPPFEPVGTLADDQQAAPVAGRVEIGRVVRPSGAVCWLGPAGCRGGPARRYVACESGCLRGGEQVAGASKADRRGQRGRDRRRGLRWA